MSAGSATGVAYQGMAIKINSNGASLSAQRQVAQTSDSLGRVFERLSSGQRINRASDDTAGLAIADTLSAKSRVFTSGIRNLNDGISLLSIADSAVSSLTDITIKLKELAEQSANGVYSSKQRQALDNEAQALSKEFARITNNTTFNGLRLFDGSVQGFILQAGFGESGFLSTNLAAQIGTGSFANSISLSAGSAPSSVTTGDLNGDGILDIVSSDAGFATLSIFLGTGAGQFSARISLATGNNPASVTLSDFNGDGILDIASADKGSDTASIFIGRGDGTFGSRATIQTSGSPVSIVSGDLNGDGIADLITADQSFSSLGLYLGRGDGTFQTRKSAATGLGVLSVAIGDINNDGALDLVTVDIADQTVSILIGRGDGSFATRTTMQSGSGPFSAILSDIDRDGSLDIISADSGGSASVLLGRGNGTFQSRYTVDVGVSPRAVLAVDFNGDGFIDLVGANQPYSTVSVALGNGTGSFGSATSFASGNSPNSLASGDINNDGIPDLISGNTGSNGLSLFLATSQNGIAPLLDFSLRTQSQSKQAFAALNNKLSLLSVQRGSIGASQSRIAVAVSALQTATENFKAAESRIRDGDVAKDTAELVRLKILQKTGIAVLSQANLQPQLALKLLQTN